MSNSFVDDTNNFDTSYFSIERGRDPKFYAQQNELTKIFHKFNDRRNNHTQAKDPEPEKNSDQSFQADTDAKIRTMSSEIEKQKIEKMLIEQSRRRKERLEIVRKREEEAEKIPKDPAYYEYLEKLEQQKPWLEKGLIKIYSLESLRNNFPLKDDFQDVNPEMKSDLDKELDFIKRHVHPLIWKPRETKSDVELLYDLRYYNKHSEYLIKRVRNENYYQRLSITLSYIAGSFLFLTEPDLNSKSTQVEVKTAFRTKALFWHPDNIRKTFKLCFANENNFTKTLTEIFGLIDEAYRVLSDKERRKAYDLTSSRKY